MATDTVVVNSSNVTELHLTSSDGPYDITSLVRGVIESGDLLISSDDHPSDFFWEDGVIKIKFGQLLSKGVYDISLSLFSASSPDALVVVHPSFPSSNCRIYCSD